MASTPTRPPSGASASGWTTSCSTRCPTCARVGNEGVGFDTIDVAALERRGIALCIPRGQNADAVADHALALLLAVRHQVVAGDRFIRDGPLGRPRGRGAGRASTSRGSTLGVVGLGNIGQAVARRAEAFGMRVVGWNRTPRPDIGDRAAASSTTCCSASDHVTLHCALADTTRGLIGERELALCCGRPRSVDQHGPRRDRRHRGARSPRCRPTGSGAPVASTCSPTSRRSTRRLARAPARRRRRRTSPTTSPRVYGALDRGRRGRPRSGVRAALSATARATLEPMAVFEYAPAPESVRPALKPRYDLFIGGAWRRSKGGARAADDQPGHRGAADRGRRRHRGRRRRRRRGRRARRTSSWSRLRGAERGKYLYRSRAWCRRRARELGRASSRSTAESRSASRATSTCRSPPRTCSTTPAGPTSCEYAVPGREARPLGVAGADHPVELPAADGGVEDRAGARVRQHRRAEAGRDDAADGAAARRDHRRGRAAAGRREHRHRRPATRAPRSSRHPDLDKVAFTGSTEVGKRSSARSPAPARRLTLELGGKAREHRLRRRAARPGRRGHRQRHLLQPGPRLLRRLAPARRGVRRTTIVVTQAAAAHAHAARGRSARQEHRRRRDQLGGAAREDPRARRGRARPRAPSAVARRAGCPRRASGSRRRSSRASRSRTGSRARRSSARCSRC